VAPFEYTAMFWATLYGFVVFGDFPDWVTGAGAVLVIGAGLYMLRTVPDRANTGRLTGGDADRRDVEC
jgi:drug/metabolite transporter (DMT)-like permease